MSVSNGALTKRTESRRWKGLAAKRGIHLSIITATNPHILRPKGYLEEAFQSLLSLQGDWQWEWLVQVDGGVTELRQTERALGKEALQDRRVILEDCSRAIGTAGARNLALRRALGGAVAYLDDDDLLLPDALDVWLPPLEDGCAWSAGQLLYEYDGEQTLLPSLMPTGDVAKGVFLDCWEGPDHRFPHPPSAFAARTEVVQALGGWQGLPQGEDLGWAGSLATAFSGYISTENVYLYRQHPGNFMAQKHFDGLELRSRAAVWKRLVELQKIF